MSTQYILSRSIIASKQNFDQSKLILVPDGYLTETFFLNILLLYCWLVLSYAYSLWKFYGLHYFNISTIFMQFLVVILLPFFSIHVYDCQFFLKVCKSDIYPIYQQNIFQTFFLWVEIFPHLCWHQTQQVFFDILKLKAR